MLSSKSIVSDDIFRDFLDLKIPSHLPKNDHKSLPSVLDRDSAAELAYELNSRISAISQYMRQITIYASKEISKIKEQCSLTITNLNKLVLNYQQILTTKNYTDQYFTQVSKILATSLKIQFIEPETQTNHFKEFLSMHIFEEIPSSRKKRLIKELPDTISSFTSETLSKLESALCPFIANRIPDDSVIKLKRNPVQLEDSSVYFGEWNKNNERHGFGIQFFQGKYKYEGYWKNDHPFGPGRLILRNGEVYEGEWSNFTLNGPGTLFLPDGSSYIGDFLHNKCEGNGVFQCKDGSYYEGSWKKGKRHGQGVLVRANGDKYTGGFARNKKRGFGVLLLADGTRYEGEWKRDLKHGQGKLVWNTRDEYCGSFVEDEMQGFGVYLYADGTRFEGEWQKGKICGRGKLSWSYGDVYTGEFVDNRIEGQGVKVYKDGRKFEGAWKNGKPDGWGVLVCGEEKVEGMWRNGHKV
jgi:hypothetical protein